MTTNATPHPALHVPARTIPVPMSVSPNAQAMLAMGIIGPPSVWPAIDDPDGWKATIADREAVVREMTAQSGPADDVEVEEVDLGDFAVYKITPAGVGVDDRRVYVELHGGGFIQDGGLICRARATDTAKSLRSRVWAVDYRMPPDHPYPEPLDDCVAGYRALLEEHRPEEIVVGGPSAGGNFTAALMLRVRDEGLPLPAAAVMNSPAVDLTESGDSWQTNEGVDTVMRGSFLPCFELYAGGHDLRDPYISPVFGDFSKGFPPTILLTGTRDKLLSDTVRFHRALRAADIPAELHVFEAAGHAGFLGMAPEDADRQRQIRRFAEEHWSQAGR